MRSPGALALALVGIGLLPHGALALDVDGVRCACADDARSRGDYVACVAQLSRRLVAAGALDERERAALIGEAARSRVPDEPLDIPCGPGPAGNLDTYGVGLQADAQAWPPGATAHLEALLWNFTPEDVTGMSGHGGGDECLFGLRLEDFAGHVLHQRQVQCPAVITEFPLPSGSVRRLAVDVDLVYLGIGARWDGLPLPPGDYIAVISTAVGYPNRSAVFDGLPAEARLMLVVEAP